MGTKALVVNTLSSERREHIDEGCRFNRDLVRTEDTKIVHADSGWQHLDIPTRAFPVTLFNRHRRASMNLGDDN